MATHSRTLAWRIPWTEEPGRLLSVGSHRGGHDRSDLAHMLTGCDCPRELASRLGISWDSSPAPPQFLTHYCLFLLPQFPYPVKKGSVRGFTPSSPWTEDTQTPFPWAKPCIQTQGDPTAFLPLSPPLVPCP